MAEVRNEMDGAVLGMDERVTWKRKKCGCIRTTLSIGPVWIRCDRHRGKPSKKRIVCHFDEDGVVTRG